MFSGTEGSLHPWSREKTAEIHIAYVEIGKLVDHVLARSRSSPIVLPDVVWQENLIASQKKEVGEFFPHTSWFSNANSKQCSHSRRECSNTTGDRFSRQFAKHHPGVNLDWFLKQRWKNKKNSTKKNKWTMEVDIWTFWPHITRQSGLRKKRQFFVVSGWARKTWSYQPTSKPGEDWPPVLIIPSESDPGKKTSFSSNAHF